VRVGWIVAKMPLKKQVGGRRQAHGGARVAISDLLDRVHGEGAAGVNRAVVEIGPLQR
jgi:hypothetical protein